ncbi:MAG: hypothetical protein WBK76_04210 [Candidatus Saccharimonadales bacterium]
MKTKNNSTETPLLWEQADHKRNGELQPTAPPAFEEFTHLSQLMDSTPTVLEKRAMGDETIEVTPTGTFRTLVEMPLDGTSRVLKLVPSLARQKGQNYTELYWGKRRIDPARVEAQAHRDETSPQIYLTIGIRSVTRVEPQFHQYTIHDGHITDVESPEKEVDADEITTVKLALSAISEQILADEETIKADKLHRKVGVWIGKRAERKQKRIDRWVEKQTGKDWGSP